MENNNVIIAITGGFASGKTTVARYIEESGYPVVYTDLLAKNVMLQASVKPKIMEAFGEGSYNPDGSLNANYLANEVFNSKDDAKLEQLNKIVHPPTIDLMMDEIERLSQAGNKYIFVESALIYEAALDDGFDYILCVTCKPNIQIERAMKRHNLDKKAVEDRIAKQIDLKTKANLADFVLSNDGGLEELKSSTAFILSILTTLEPKEEEE